MEEEVSLKDLILQMKAYFNYLLSKWLIIGIIGLLGGGIGLMIALKDNPVYEGKLKFMVDEESQASRLASIASSFGFNAGDESASLLSSSNLIDFLQTRSMVEEALLRPISEKQYNSTTYAEYFVELSGMRDEMEKEPDLNTIHFQIDDDREQFSRAKDSILKKIYTNLITNDLLTATQPNQENSFIVIKCRSENEVFAKNFPQELLNVAAEYYIESKTSKTQENVDVLEHQVDSVKQVLYSSMSGAAISQDKVFGLNPAMNIERVPAARQQTRSEISLTVLKELVKNLEISKMNLLSKTPVVTIVDHPSYPLKKEQLGIVKGIALGGLIAGILIVLGLIVRKYIRDIMKGD